MKKILLLLIILPVLNSTCRDVPPIITNDDTGDREVTDIDSKQIINDKHINKFQNEPKNLITDINTTFVKNFRWEANSCFMHTALQAIMSTLLNLYSLNDLKHKVNALDNAIKNNNSIESRFTQIFIKMIKKYLEEGNTNIEYENITKPLRELMHKIKPEIPMYKQSNEIDFFSNTVSIIDATEKQLPAPYKPLLNYFDIERLSKNTCTRCGSSMVMECGTVPTIVITNLYDKLETLEKYLESYFYLDGNNKMKLETGCKCPYSYKFGSIIIKKHPKVLIVQLLRGQDPIQKTDELITYPKDLTLQGVEYKLISVTMHIGDTINSGHYKGYISVNDKWYLTDDLSRGAPIELTEDEELNQKDASMLIYRRVS